MPIVYKIDVIPALKAKGYNTGRIRREKIMGESYLQQLRQGELVSWKALEKICALLECQPGDLLAYIPDKDDA